MFAGCENITKIDFTTFITKDVIDMKYMFSGCTELKYLDLSSFNTKNVTNMSGMFGEFNDTFFNIDKFNNIDINNMPKDFSGNLSGCENLININISSFDTSNVTNMMFMFGGCLNLNNLYLSVFNTKNVKALLI